jgi:hypothetical protein
MKMRTRIPFFLNSNLKQFAEIRLKCIENRDRACATSKKGDITRHCSRCMVHPRLWSIFPCKLKQQPSWQARAMTTCIDVQRRVRANSAKQWPLDYYGHSAALSPSQPPVPATAIPWYIKMLFFVYSFSVTCHSLKQITWCDDCIANLRLPSDHVQFNQYYDPTSSKSKSHH